MDQMQVYKENIRIFDLGIDSGILKSPYKLTSQELDCLEGEINNYSQRFGEEAALVEWGQPFGGPLDGRKYHPRAAIQSLQEEYNRHELRGICPRAGAVFDQAWIQEQRERLQQKVRQPPFDINQYLEFARNTHF